MSELLVRGVSINLYMFHGGTSFGFMNGAMDFGTYKPQVTSYGGSRAHRGCFCDRYDWILLISTTFVNVFAADYDAPLSEAGDYTLKYQVLRTLFSQYHCNNFMATLLP